MNKTKKPARPATELSRELQAKCTKIRGLMVKEAAGNKPAYQIGVEVYEVRRDPSAYGKGSVAAMARALGCTAALLYSYAEVAEAWPKEAAFAAMSEKINRKGLPLTFSHFIAIAAAAPNARQDLFQAALNDSLSVRALKKAGGARAKRKQRAATGLLAIVGHLLASTKAALEDANEVSNELARQAAAPSTSMPSAETLHTIIDTYKKLEVKEGIIRLHLEALLASGGRSPDAVGGRPIALLPPPSPQAATPSNAGDHASKKAVGT